MPKRLLPKPSAPDDNQSFRVKSKSTTNISTKSGPVKPTHMSVSDIPHINIDDPDQSEIQSTTSEKSRTELASKLNQEFSKRKQATELVKQLQLDYDKLLSKYATAELTIDQLRLGARINLHSNSPTPSQATTGSFPPAQRQEAIMVNQSMSRGMKSPSPFQGSLGTMSPQSIVKVFTENKNKPNDNQDNKNNNGNGNQGNNKNNTLNEKSGQNSEVDRKLKETSGEVKGLWTGGELE
ncbi:hypothetical protein KUTeg_001136 [Tegillarca granosa]|uniref:Uncharacterized protein n=1 Tax=Tegillarca granosa TaxID=220873 RepID=A0ABQ9FVK6_TEGGR|nr:hypothetical protein KUTeg_001136 [Tegillarca granosa]